ncbi:cytochrome P450 [Mycena galericulata]|nr:cytochrome P450 [Mycena galericulata]
METRIDVYSAVVGLSCLGLGMMLWKLRSMSNLRKMMPPGPPGLPFLGNVFQLPQFQWLRFTEWKAQYGPIISLNLAGQPVVVLNDHQIATDLLDRRSAIYSDRPQFIMAGEILTGGIFIAFSTYGELWKKLRRAAHEGLNHKVSQAYEPIQEREAASLLKYMIEQPELWEDNLKRASASTVLGVVYGWPGLDETGDNLVTRVNDLMHRLVRAALPGAFLVEIFPFMNKLPECMAKWKREGREWHRKDTLLFEGMMNDVKALAESGASPSCFAGHLIGNPRSDLTEKESAWLAGTMFGAGAETTAAALSVFILAMTLYPDVMRTAQVELDEVVGRGRMPSFSDRPNLPYVEAIVKEVLRWRPVGPLGLPRRTLSDDWYNGYLIPKGTIVIYNVWAIHRDPEIFPDFDEFRPERFLEQPNLYHTSYGFGRRICVGMAIANQTLFIDIACMLSALEISAPVDSQGRKILPSRTACVDEGLVVRPVPFECRITPRFA